MKRLIFIIPTLVLIGYLYFTYANFYNRFKEMNLQSPYKTSMFVLESGSSIRPVIYMALGDSLSAGVGSDDEKETFVYMVANKLSIYTGKLTVYNMATPGDTTKDLIEKQLPAALQLYPDQITLLIGVNDIHNHRSASDFKEKYRFILQELMNKTPARVTVINLPYLGSSRTVLPPYNWILDFRTRQFNKTIEDLVVSENQNDRLRLVDLYSKTYKIGQENPNYYSPDLFHPSGEGYKIWAEIINAD